MARTSKVNKKKQTQQNSKKNEPSVQKKPQKGKKNK